MRDIRVELTDEFDRNFERKAFFDRPWAPLSKNYHPKTGSMLNRTGALRHSLHGRIDGTRLIFSSSLPYAGIHNFGGIIRQDFVPTPRMRKRAMAKYKKSRSEGDLRVAVAKRVKRTIKIPARPFVGDHPRVREVVSEVVSLRIRKEVKEGALKEELRKFK